MKDFKKTASFGRRDFGARSSFGAKHNPSSFGGSDEGHQATCDGCHKSCVVPFVPNGKKPVYCRNCYRGKETTTSFTGQPFTRSNESTQGDASDDLKRQFSILNTKLDRLTAAIEAQTRVLSATE